MTNRHQKRKRRRKRKKIKIKRLRRLTIPITRTISSFCMMMMKPEIRLVTTTKIKHLRQRLKTTFLRLRRRLKKLKALLNYSPSIRKNGNMLQNLKKMLRLRICRHMMNKNMRIMNMMTAPHTLKLMNIRLRPLMSGNMSVKMRLRPVTVSKSGSM